MIDGSSPGSTFFLPHGARLLNRLVAFMRAQQRVAGFDEVLTPVIYKNELWKQSGHWAHYKKDMFEVRGASHGEGDATKTHDNDDAHGYSLKPMNCPGHCVMFGSEARSYRDLPVRYSDFSPLHRNEASGALSGLTRVRKFHQDDGHIFCTESQVLEEMRGCLAMLERVYKVFGLGDYDLVLSTRPDEFIGSVDAWDRAEAALREALDATGRSWAINAGDGAFYGPKIDVLVRDNAGKQHQAATIQLDFQLPRNFDLKYDTEAGSETRPVMIHRAIFGSLERFIALLVDHYQGKWPFWLNPRQAAIIPVAERHAEYARSVVAELSGTSVGDNNTAAELDRRFFAVDLLAQNEPVGARIRRAVDLAYSYIILVGDKEADAGTVALRERGHRAAVSKTVAEVRSIFTDLERSYQ